MGNKLSAKRKNRNRCTCYMYIETKHCCQGQCFRKIKNVQALQQTSGVRERAEWCLSTKQIDIVFSAISALDLPAIFATIICSYFERKDLDGEYLQFYHGAINGHIARGGPVCEHWIRHKLDRRRDRDIKVGLFGEDGAGKSALVIQFRTGNYVEAINYEMSIDLDFKKGIAVDGIDNFLTLTLLDTKVNEFWSMRDCWFRENDIIVLCFAIHQKGSLDQCIQDLQRIPDICDFDIEGHSEKGVWWDVRWTECTMEEISIIER